nr:hypothetical protein CFP56_17724 [Quercus suber]
MVSLDWLKDIASNYLKSLVLLGGVEVKLWLNSLERLPTVLSHLDRSLALIIQLVVNRGIIMVTLRISYSVETMDAEKKSPKLVRLPPQRGQVKVRIFKEWAKEVKSAISAAGKKLGCSGGSASSSRVQGSYDSKGDS